MCNGRPPAIDDYPEMYGEKPESGPASEPAYHRPKTRGELRDKLKEGITCEVVASDTNITSHALAWLDLWENVDYWVRSSKNEGWDLFVPSMVVCRK